jgi:CheY-like chemotaxis protein
MAMILVVDDDADTCRNMVDLFGDLGYDVDSADGGMKALEKATRQPYELGLLDLRMPGMDGITLCRQLKQLHPRMTTMIVTAYSGANTEAEAREAGAKHVLLKPVSFPKLLALVRQSLPTAS